jgi:PAS domain S-box-containing protein
MPTAQKTRRELVRAIETLQARLAEAEETLHAIRSGQVDALLISGPVVDQVFTLKGAEHPYRIIIETINEGAVTLTLAGTILYSNRRFAELIATPLEQTIGAAFQRFVAPADRPAFDALLEQGRQGSSSGEIVIQAGEQHVPVLLSTRALKLDTLQGVCIVVTNISQQKRVEEDLRRSNAEVEQRTAELSVANAELTRAARLKDEFLASMSHELRTPLNAVLGLAEALQEGVYGSLNEQQRTSIQRIEASGRHLLALINDILDLAKIGAGKIELEYDSVSIEEICRASLQLIRPDAQNKQLAVELMIDPAIGLVYVDARRVKQMLVNLLSNAIKFTPQGGAIGLDMRGDADRQVLDLTVWDSGIGIAPADLSRLFQPFTQLDGQLNRQYNGSGLGLTLVARLAELHGGSVSVASTPGVGSRFTVALPWHIPNDHLDISRVQSAPPAAEQPAALTLPVILLAEDNEIGSVTIADYLKAQGYRVLVARNGAEAVARAGEAQPALILMDIQMPGMDGLEAIRQIRAQNGMDGIPIIALTALAMPGDRERCLAAGADDYLSKPVSLKGLAATIAEQIRQAIDRVGQT